MANCCSKCFRNNSPPQIMSVTGDKDLVDVEHERTRQAAIALNVGKGPVKLEGKFRIGFEKESFTRYKRHPPEERGSIDSVYEKIGPVPLDNQAIKDLENKARNFTVPIDILK